MTDSVIRELKSESTTLPHLDLLHYLLSHSGEKQVAHCLDLDLIATGQSYEDAAVNLDRLVKAHIELALATQQLANLATKAPQSFWDQYADGKPIDLEPRTLRIRIPESVQIIPVSEGKLKIFARAAHAA